MFHPLVSKPLQAILVGSLKYPDTLSGFKAIFVEKAVRGVDIVQPEPVDVSELPPEFEVKIGYYPANQDATTQPSGAYIFRPQVQQMSFFSNPTVELVNGSMVDEYWITYAESWASLVLRKYENQDEWEVEWLVGPISSMNFAHLI